MDRTNLQKLRDTLVVAIWSVTCGGELLDWNQAAWGRKARLVEHGLGRAQQHPILKYLRSGVYSLEPRSVPALFCGLDAASF